MHLSRLPPLTRPGSEPTRMVTIAYHQQLAVLAHERGDYLAARHHQDAANCYPKQEQGEPCRKLAEQELAHREQR